MSHQGWQETLVSAFSDGTAVTGTAEASLLPGQAKYSIPANFLDFAGKKIRVRAAGRISNIVTTPGTLTLRFKLGPSSAIIAWNSGAIALNTTAKTNVSWMLDLAMDLRTIGSGTGGTLIGLGSFQAESVVGSAAGLANTAMVPASAPAVGAGFDTTVANVADLTAQFSLTGNSMTLHQYALESMN